MTKNDYCLLKDDDWFYVTATLFMSLKTQIPAVPMVLPTNFLGSNASLSAQKAVS